MNILIIEDQPDLGQLVADHLITLGIKSEIATTGEMALETIDVGIHDLVILDRGLPDMEGLELLKIMREEGMKMPVLVLTAKDGLGDKVEGLNSGADDYLVKPFDMDELVARIHALNRRPSEAVNSVLKMGNLEFASLDGIIKIDDISVELSAKEKDALEKLMRLPGRVVSKDTLLSALYGHGEEGSDNSIEVVMHRLRKKLQKANANVEIKTLRGIGYLLKNGEET